MAVSAVSGGAGTSAEEVFHPRCPWWADSRSQPWERWGELERGGAGVALKVAERDASDIIQEEAWCSEHTAPPSNSAKWSLVILLYSQGRPRG